ncbi:ketopantoate reductase family protein [Pararhodobacter oceanensis]|uniref:ketopantoate reductase family protein n=1 Tax=Pararhodobacter oceanensis TaxID=2172121 RepID=UPI003A9266B2
MSGAGGLIGADVEPARIGILGCGAMGSVYAALFAEAGAQVIALNRKGAHLGAIAAHGLRLSGASGDRVVHLQTYAMPPERAETLPPLDLLIVATKSMDAAQATRDALPLLAPQTLVLTIQNGLGTSDQLAGIVGAERLAVGIAAAFGASIQAPGHAHHAHIGSLTIGAYRGLDAAQVARIAALWRAAGIRAEAVADIAAMQWEKLICNAAFSGLCGVTGLRVGEVMASAELAPLAQAAAGEAYAVAQAAGVALTVRDPVAHAMEFGEKVRAAKPSVLLDIEAGRRSEIEVINGAIDPIARRFGTIAPVNATIAALVRHREQRAGLRGDSEAG